MMCASSGWRLEARPLTIMRISRTLRCAARSFLRIVLRAVTVVFLAILLLLVCHSGWAFPLSRAPRFGQFHTDSSQSGFCGSFSPGIALQDEKKTKESLQGLKPDSSDDIFGGVETPPFRSPLVDLPLVGGSFLVGPRFPFAVPAVALQFLKKRGIEWPGVA